MAYLLDTDVSLDYLGGNPTVKTVFEAVFIDGVAISVVSYMELYEGVERSMPIGDYMASLHQFLLGVPVIDFSIGVAQKCARLRSILRQQGRSVRPRALDLVIAATALYHDLTLVTRNLADYQDIPGIRLYDPNVGSL